MRLKDYECIVGQEVLDSIKESASALEDKHIVHVNSTYYGGGVAEMLNSLVPLFNDAGIKTGWRAIKGNPDYFSITKKFHNALQGEDINFTKVKQKIFEETNRINSIFTHIAEHDYVIVHDAQPLPLITHYRKRQPWIWRCHVDLSSPDKETWSYLKKYVSRYDYSIASKKEYVDKIPTPVKVIHPSIDPLSPKNKTITDTQTRRILHKFGIEQDKPIVSQVSRFDKWKDPIGVINVFRKVRERTDCRLVLLGSMANDDPEGQQVYNKIMAEAKHDQDIHVINYENHFLVNALQRASSVVIQKSIREGFGLTVSEALWKKTPVVASRAGGIPLQIQHGSSGYLSNSDDQCAGYVLKLLKNPKKARQMGENGHETVKKRFLITRHLKQYLDLIKQVK
jgi:trehalose synthase